MAKVCNHHTKLDDILDRVKDIQITLSQGKRKLLPPIAKPTDMEPCDERVKQLQVCRSVQEIIDNFEEFRYRQEDGLVMCTLCCTDEHAESFKVGNSSLHGSTVSGIFLYDQSCGLSFNTNENLPRPFINLKKKFESSCHRQK